ncbi:hypothetical protein AcW1_009916 [Taiwanofungus camphoratus]|nr:hypothetical protein AcV5_003248 [Antrodia cinnamomea]KAI0929410.1 hypothetical protein AcV7_005268 [Antrodia cinnamomea]KAI0946461.1 hypothetical protein AcW1_009916 [Antrodia cinnamomea]
MAPSPQCSALAAAKDKKGLSYGQIATQLNVSEQRVIDICTGAAVPTTSEFNSLASVLGIKAPVPQDSAHVRV